MLILSSCTVGILAGLLFEDAFFKFFPMELILVCLLLPVAGYTLGYLLAWLVGQDPPCWYAYSTHMYCYSLNYARNKRQELR